MGDLNRIQFLLFMSLMIFSAHALDVIISGAHQNFKQRSEIKTKIEDGERIYAGTLNPLIYEAGVNISNVIVYIIDRSRYVEVTRSAVCLTRWQIADELKLWNCELVFLGIENFDDDEYDLIGGFILETIQPHPDQTNHALTIQVIGENHFDRSYQCLFAVFERYQEYAQICGGALSARLRAIHHGSLRPVESNYNKFIKLRTYLPPHYTIDLEATWSVPVLNDTYEPKVDVNGPEFNLRIRHPNWKICILVLDERQYVKVATLGNYSSERRDIRKLQRRMTRDSEVLYIMGAFNFDWYDVYLVTQIILKHTQGSRSSGYNVLACGFGMFNTYYLNCYVDDGRFIQPPEPDSSVWGIMEALMREKVKERAINMYCADNGWKNEEIPINLVNGQYVPVGRFNDYTFPWLYQRIAFIVYNQSEKNPPGDFNSDSVVYQYARELERSNIYVVLIEAINFGLYDLHIIAEWVEEHRGQINPQQIAILGGGTFDTIFQSKRNTYNRFFNVGINELNTIRNALVKIGNEKKVLVAKINDMNFKAWSYPMNTVNGVYEPDLIPDGKMFDTTDGTNILFFITSAYNFRQIAAIRNVGTIALKFRKAIEKQYPIWEWSTILVGLDNFGQRDSHLFAAFVKTRTHDERPSAEFVHVINYGIKEAVYLYKDTLLHNIKADAVLKNRFKSHFGKECSLLDDTRDVD